MKTIKNILKVFALLTLVCLPLIACGTNEEKAVIRYSGKLENFMNTNGLVGTAAKIEVSLCK